jgi:membrane associated rhomboid family serine protease
MLIPVTHENMQGRRWPLVTIAIILLNVAAFLGTHWRLEDDARQVGTVKIHIILFAGSHPNLQMTPAAKKLVDSFERDHPKEFEQLTSQNRPVEDAWDAQMRMADPDNAQEVMTDLCAQYAQLQKSSILERFAFIPSQPHAVAYLTANFLHSGWLHLIFNMWFLWLAGTILEDTWGRVLYPIFYLVAGALALLFHAMMYPNSIIPTIGASGAVAGLMGAFLVRFPKTKIQMWWILFLLYRFRVYKFRAPAYALLPLWLGIEFLSGTFLGGSSGVAHWAHVGGFLFGAGIAMILRMTGIEQKADQAIEAKVSWTADPRLVQATDALGQNQPDAAIPPLMALLREQPDSLEGHDLLAKAYWKKQDIPAYRDEMAILCRLHVNTKELDAALQDYEDFTRAGGEKPHKAIWMELCRYLENEKNWDRAAREFEKLAKAYPQDRLSVPALVSAARLQQKQLYNSVEALRLYRAAEASSAPHLDSDSAAIRAGLQQLQNTLVPQGTQQ